jgi:branched-chain amino acid transport system substrate-binding protein
LGACGGGEAADAEDAGPAKVGLIMELSGQLGFLGESGQRGAELALAELASNGMELEVATCDTQSDPAVAMECYERLVGRDQVDALIGPILSPNAAAISPSIQSDQVPTFVLAGSYGQYDMGGNPYMFGMHAVSEDVMSATWNWAREDNLDSAYLIASADATGDSCRRFVEDEEWADEREGIELLGQAELEASAQTAATQMAEVPADAGFIFLCVGGASGIVAAQAYEQSGLEMPAVQLHSQGLPALAERMSQAVRDDVMFVPSFCPLAAAAGELEGTFACAEQANAFTEAFKAEHPDVTPDYFAAAAYDAVMQLGRALEESDGTADGIVEWLENQTIVGASGTYEYSPDRHRGLGVDSVIMAVLRGGEWQLDSMLDAPQA